MSTRPISKIMLMAVGMVSCVSFGFIVQTQHHDGYKDTPILPGQKWHVHDIDRPYPHEVVPADRPGDPPSDAVVLFDGKDLSHWAQSDSDSPVPPKWKVKDGNIEVVGGTGNLYSREKFGDCQLHIEWQEDKNVKGRGQGRGNSGVFLMGRYEIQVLDSYRAPTYADGQAGAIYGQWPPLVNPQRKPGDWQTYDIIFKAPHFEGDKLVEPAYVTVIFNGVVVHDHQKLNGLTGHGNVFPYEHHESEERLALQDHGPATPLHFRNIWVRRMKPYDQPEN